MAAEIAIRRPPGATRLEDNAQWKNRFEIRSETSDRLYIVSENKQSGKWGCSCPGYRTKRKCKHLMEGCGLLESQIHGNGSIGTTPKKRGLK